MGYVIGIDLGGTNLRIGAVTLDGRVVHRLSRKTEVELGVLSIMEGILADIEKVMEGVQGMELMGIGLAIPGAILIEKGIITQSPNLTGWDGFHLRDYLSERLTHPFFIDNDANAFAIGEGWMGRARGIKNYCVLTLGTGIGGGIVLNGEVWHGPDGTAGEVGHIVVEPDGCPCRCGGWGCLEVYASSTGLVRMAKEVGCGGEIPPEVIAQRAQAGDELYKGLFHRLGRYLGIAMATLVNLLNLELIIIGGGLAKASSLFLDIARDEIKKRALKMPGERVKIEITGCGDDGGVLGAAYIALSGVRGQGRLEPKI